MNKVKPHLITENAIRPLSWARAGGLCARFSPVSQSYIPTLLGQTEGRQSWMTFFHLLSLPVTTMACLLSVNIVVREHSLPIQTNVLNRCHIKLLSPQHKCTFPSEVPKPMANTMQKLRQSDCNSAFAFLIHVKALNGKCEQPLSHCLQWCILSNTCISGSTYICDRVGM